jgi:transposase InsO family protein
LNNVTKPSTYPIPLIADLLDCFNGAKFFSSIDLASGYWQIRLAADSVDKTTFNSKFGSYRFRVMPFGVCNGPATFQRLMDEVFKDLKWKGVCVYFDDVFIYSKTFKEHMELLQQVFERLRRFELQAKAAKCQFVAKEIVFVGHLVSADGIRPDPSKIEVVRQWQSPVNTREVREFVGLCSYYRKFIPQFATVAAPLHRLQSEKVPFLWCKDCEAAFQSLKAALTSAPLLVMPDFSKPFILQTDASNVGVGAILSQSDDQGEEHVIAYASKALNSAQRNYTVTDQELYAVVYGVKQFRCYLLGRPFKIYTDHQALKWLKTMRVNRDLSGRLARYQMFLMEYDFEPYYRKGLSNANADALSRMRHGPSTGSSDTAVMANIASSGPEREADEAKEPLPPPLTTAQALARWARLQREDASLFPMIQYLDSAGHVVPPIPAERDALLSVMQQGKYRLSSSGLLVHTRYRNGELLEQIVVPEPLKAEILHQFHADRYAAHLGVHKTYEKILSRFHWKGLFQAVKNYVLSCPACSARKDPKRAAEFPTISFVPEGLAMEDISYDALGPFPITAAGNRHIIIFMCRLTKWCECFAVPSVDEHTVAKLIAEELMPRYGCPRSILSDGAKAFNSKLMDEIYILLNSRKITITPHNPQHNGQVERFNHTLVNMLSIYVDKDQSNWDQHINVCQFAYRSAVNASTGYSPFYLLYGREPHYPLDAMLKRREYWENESDYVSVLIQRLTLAQDIARAQLLRRQERLASETEDRQYHIDYALGDKVWFHIPDRVRGLTNKLRSRWYLYSVVERLSLVNYRIVRHLADGTEDSRVVNVRKLKPHTEPSILSRLAQELQCTPEVEDVMEHYQQLQGEGGDDIEQEDEYEVEAILGRRQRRDRVQYLVKWKGYEVKESTWEPADHLIHAGSIVAEYEEKCRR